MLLSVQVRNIVHTALKELGYDLIAPTINVDATVATPRKTSTRSAFEKLVGDNPLIRKKTHCYPYSSGEDMYFGVYFHRKKCHFLSEGSEMIDLSWIKKWDAMMILHLPQGAHSTSISVRYVIRAGRWGRPISTVC